jgi:hypothetical protein
VQRAGAARSVRPAAEAPSFVTCWAHRAGTPKLWAPSSPNHERMGSADHAVGSTETNSEVHAE